MCYLNSDCQNLPFWYLTVHNVQDFQNCALHLGSCIVEVPTLNGACLKLRFSSSQSRQHRTEVLKFHEHFWKR